eukprot:scaffold152626_cov27-Tisochrysis_lutea.AAC.3
MEVVPTASNSTAAGEAPRNSRAQLFDRLLQALNDARTQARTAMKGRGCEFVCACSQTPPPYTPTPTHTHKESAACFMNILVSLPSCNP